MTASIETNGRTRESWMEAAIKVFRPRFVELEYPLPEKIHISVGFPHGRAPENRVILAETMTRRLSKDGVNHVFISPIVSDPAEVLCDILHELIHVALDNEDGHTGRFVEIAKALGFVGKPTETPAGPTLAAEFMVLAESLGEFPHGAVDLSLLRRPALVPAGGGAPVSDGPRPTSGVLPQRNRYYGAICRNEGCDGFNDYRVRMSRKWMETALPVCGMCGVRMTASTDL
jgi:hypothetical protein